MMAQSSPHTRGSWRAASRGTAARIAGVTALVGLLAGNILRTSAAEPIKLLSVTAEGQAVVIEATEPAAYTVNRVDPVTLVVDLRNAAVAAATTRVEAKGAVAGLRLEQATAADGLGVARVRIALNRAAEYRVRSTRNTIRVELTAGAADKAPVAKPAGKPAPAVAVLPPEP
jgi:hypothetical protein